MFDYSLLPAVLSAIAAGFAALAAWRIPTATARLAEELRRGGARAQEREKAKLSLFTTLMQERAAIHSENSVRALNLIDVVFNESREVREAWAQLLQAFSTPNIPAHVIDERLRNLLAVMARDIGLTDQLRPDDLGRVYVPNALQEERYLRDMERRRAIARLQGETAPTANTAGPQSALWPPRPE
jgi:hypothetical protein